MKNAKHPSTKLTLKKERLVKLNMPAGNKFGTTITQPTSQSTLVCMGG